MVEIPPRHVLDLMTDGELIDLMKRSFTSIATDISISAALSIDEDRRKRLHKLRDRVDEMRRICDDLDTR